MSRPPVVEGTQAGERPASGRDVMKEGWVAVEALTCLTLLTTGL